MFFKVLWWQHSVVWILCLDLLGGVDDSICFHVLSFDLMLLAS